MCVAPVSHSRLSPAAGSYLGAHIPPGLIPPPSPPNCAHARLPLSLLGFMRLRISGHLFCTMSLGLRLLNVFSPREQGGTDFKDLIPPGSVLVARGET